MPDLLNSDYVFVTKEGLAELEEVLEARETNHYRNKKVPDEAGVARQVTRRTDRYVSDIIKPITESEHIEKYLDELPMHLQTESLKSYMDDLHRL